MGSLYQIVYTSTASESFSRADLKELLMESVQRNTRAGITGLLLYNDGTFMQTLEGEEPVVMALFTKISRDPRHHHVIALIHGPINRRDFSDSAMAFRDLNSPELRELPGYSEFLNTPLNGDLLAPDLPKCQQLLLLFKENIH
ncbi:MAG: BLUF domain-containing protein [Verrucomicrobiia bacterium]